MKKVALALSSGGPRGFAYIGAIEELLARGYEITSVAGASAGSLVGGVFAAGGLEAFKRWLFRLDPMKVVTLMDFSISRNHLVKGERVIDAIREQVPEINIEDLPIPFTAIATDLFTGEEVIFREGPLFEAIRASISIPSMFRPVRWKDRTLIDGGIANTFPLNRVQRTEGDILVGFNVNRIDAEQIHRFLEAARRKMVPVVEASVSPGQGKEQGQKKRHRYHRPGRKTGDILQPNRARLDPAWKIDFPGDQ